MRGFLTLLRKEWRDTRTIVLACAALAPIALLLAHQFVEEPDNVNVAAQLVVPAVIALFALVIAADLVAADVASGRAGTYAALPTPPGTSWMAKLAYLAVMIVAFGTWTLACGLLVHLFGPNPGDAWTYIELTPKSLGVLTYAVPLVAAVLLASTLAQRGFTGVCGGCVIVAAVIACGAAVNWVQLEFVPDKHDAMLVGLLVACTFVGGAGLAYVKGPVHAAPIARRAVLAFAVPLGVLIPAGVATAAVLHDRMQVEVGDPRVSVHPLRWSPDGRHLLVLAHRPDNPHAIHRVWALDVRSGTIAPFPVKGLELSSGFAWTEGGARVVAANWWKNPDALTYEFDLGTGEILRTRSVEQLEAHGEQVFELDDHLRSHTTAGGRVWTDNRIDGSLLVPTELTQVSTQSMPGRLLLRHEQDGSLHVGNLADGTITRVTGAHAGVHLSPDGHYAVAWKRESFTTFDVEHAEDARAVQKRHGVSAGTKRASTRTVIDLNRARVASLVHDPYGTAFPGGGSPHHVVAYSSDEPTLLIDLRDGTQTVLDPDPNRYGAPWDLIKVRHDGDYALTDPRGRLLLFDAETGGHRLLYAPR